MAERRLDGGAGELLRDTGRGWPRGRLELPRAERGHALVRGA